MSVFAKLQQARIKLQNSGIKKTGYNKFAGWSYYELGDFLPQTQVIFADLGLCGVVSFGLELATLRIYEIEPKKDEPFSWLEITSPMGSAALKGVHEVQNIGAVETYQRRYLWMAAMELCEGDVLDTSVDTTKKTHSATDGAYDKLNAPQKLAVNGIAEEITKQFNDGNENDSFDIWAHGEADNDVKVAIWSLLDSKPRTFITKRAKEERLKEQEKLKEAKNDV